MCKALPLRAEAELLSMLCQPGDGWVGLCNPDGILWRHHLCHSDLIEIRGVPQHMSQHCCTAFPLLQAAGPAPSQEPVPGTGAVGVTKTRARRGALREQIIQGWGIPSQDTPVPGQEALEWQADWVSLLPNVDGLQYPRMSQLTVDIFHIKDI